VIRPLGIILSVLGWYLLFAPIIGLIAWIPLVGSLLSTIVAFAAFIFSLIVGTTVACLILALAWLVFRPLYGVILLTVTGVGIYFIFFFKDPRSKEVIE
jgi:hypothetical protein